MHSYGAKCLCVQWCRGHRGFELRHRTSQRAQAVLPFPCFVFLGVPQRLFHLFPL